MRTINLEEDASVVVASENLGSDTKTFRKSAELQEVLSWSIDGNDGKVRDKDGNVVDTTVIVLDRNAFEKGFKAPFVLVMNGSFNRETFHRSIMQFLNSENFEDKTMKNRFIAWYCEMFRVPQDTFDNEEKLEEAERRLESSLHRMTSARERVTEAKETPKIKTTDHSAMGGKDEEK
jgi:hypothetical protein